MSFYSSPKVRKTWLLFKLYVVADTLLDRTLQNKVIDQFMKSAEASAVVMDTSAIHYVWENTGPRAALRRCLIDFAVGTLSYDSLLRERQTLGNEFVADLGLRLLELREKGVTKGSESESRYPYRELEEG